LGLNASIMKIQTEQYRNQLQRWPTAGRHILAQFDRDGVIVYQAYRPAIGLFAVKHQHFGGEFSFSRMSWIKPNFLWMMYRSDWGTKEGQEVTLAIRLSRLAFDEILKRAVYSSYVPEVYGSPENWRTLLAESPVRLQWDPDHDPCGGKQDRRAIQLGLAGEVIRKFANEWIINIEDISEFVAEQRKHAKTIDFAHLLTPREEIYEISDSEVSMRLGVSQI
jgi:hypothetical protein